MISAIDGIRTADPQPAASAASSISLGSEYAQALFLHIPKTAGKSFQRVLDEMGLRRRLLLPDKPRLFSVLREAPSYPVVHGHVMYPISAVLMQPLFVMTFLRDPVSRVISYYEYMERSMREGRPRAVKRVEQWRRRGFESALDIATRGAATNGQVSFLGADFDFSEFVAAFERGDEDSYAALRRERNRARGREAFARAKERLERMPFVGITEHFGESVRLFAHVIGVPSAAEGTYRNVAPTAQRDGREARYGQHAVDAIAEANRLDVELYDFARELFERRYRETFREEPGSAGAGRR